MLGFPRRGALQPARFISMIDKQKAVFSMAPIAGAVSDNNSSWRLYNAWGRVNGLGLRMHTFTWKAVIKIWLHYNTTCLCCMCASLHLKWAIYPQNASFSCLYFFFALWILVLWPMFVKECSCILEADSCIFAIKILLRTKIHALLTSTYLSSAACNAWTMRCSNLRICSLKHIFSLGIY